MKMIENIQKFTAEKGKGKKIGLKFIIMITFVLTSFGIFSDNLSKDKKELIQYKVNRKSIDTYLRGESMTERNWKSEELKKDIITNSNILDALKETFGEDVIGIDISGLGGNERTEVITVLNDAKRLSLKKRLVAQGDGSLIVEEDVTCDYVRHDTKELD